MLQKTDVSVIVSRCVCYRKQVWVLQKTNVF